MSQMGYILDMIVDLGKRDDLHSHPNNESSCHGIHRVIMMLWSLSYQNCVSVQLSQIAMDDFPVEPTQSRNGVRKANLVSDVSTETSPVGCSTGVHWAIVLPTWSVIPHVSSTVFSASNQKHVRREREREMTGAEGSRNTIDLGLRLLLVWPSPMAWLLPSCDDGWSDKMTLKALQSCKRVHHAFDNPSMDWWIEW